MHSATLLAVFVGRD